MRERSMLFAPSRARALWLLVGVSACAAEVGGPDETIETDDPPMTAQDARSSDRAPGPDARPYAPPPDVGSTSPDTAPPPDSLAPDTAPLSPDAGNDGTVRTDTGHGADGPADTAAISYPRPCSDIFDEALLPTFDLVIPAENLAKLKDLFNNHVQRKKEGVDLKQYIPATSFRYGTDIRTGILVRLKGNDAYSWTPSQNKMQLVIKFPKDRLFHGLRRLNMDAPWYDPSLLRERAATRVARDNGLVASCANNARLNINGVYYGFYANIEFADEQFLKRNFANPKGNLWKRGQDGFDLEEGTDNGDLKQLMATFDLPTLQKIGDLDQWVSEWALEAILPNGDGYWCCGHNWLMYHDPIRGWQWVLNDADAAFGWGIRGPDVNPITCSGFTNRNGPTKHFDTLIALPEYAKEYREAMARHLMKYDVAVLQKRIDTWNAQVRAAAEADPHRSFKTGERDADVAKLRAFFPKRRDYLVGFLAR